MFNLKKKTKEDNGNAVIVLGILLIVSLILVGGLLLDISKAYQLKSSYTDAGKKATQTAIMKQDSKGHLTPEAAGEAIYVYENTTRKEVLKKDNFFSKCSTHGDNEVIYKIYYKNEAGGELFVGQISRANATGSAKDIAQYMGANSKKWDIKNGNYTSIRMDFTEATENVILPGAFSMTQAEEGAVNSIKCQLMDVAARANVFTGREGSYN